MSNSNDFLDTLHEKQAKDEQNRKRQGNGNPAKKSQIKHINNNKKTYLKLSFRQVFYSSFTEMTFSQFHLS